MIESILHAVLSHDGVVTGLLFTHLLASKSLLLWSCEDPQQLLLSNRVRNKVYHYLKVLPWCCGYNYDAVGIVSSFWRSSQSSSWRGLC